MPVVEVELPEYSDDDLRQIIMEVPGFNPYALAGDCVFVPEAAHEVIDFFHHELTHVKGAKARTPFVLERWQIAILANAFGWKRPDGTRRFRELFLYVPRKNGKTALAAGVILYALVKDNEYGAEIYGAASEYKQASLVFEHARGMVLQNADLLDKLQIYKGQSKSIIYEDTLSAYRVICADPDSAHGQNTHMAVIDELHTLPNADLVDTLMTSTGARLQPLIAEITTADYDRESVCNDKHDYAVRVRDGQIDDESFLPVIYEATLEDDWKDPKIWAKANPNMAVSVSEEYLARECKRAEDSPVYENTFKRLHLNIRTKQDIRWLSMEKWDLCDHSTPVESLSGLKCHAAMDLSSTTDLSSIGLIFPPSETGGLYVFLPIFWVPRESARERERRDKVPYQLWIDQGLIRVTDGDVIDYDVIRNEVIELGKTYNIVDIAIDRWNATQITNQLIGDGFDMVPYGQGFRDLSAPSKELEKIVISGQLDHMGNPVIRWMAGNVAVEQDAAANIKPSKKKSTERIDGIVTAIMAIGRATSQDVKKESVYEKRGVRRL